MASETKASEHIVWYCLPDSSLLLSYNPETSSRVTLATLGTVFQTDHLTTQSSNNKTTKPLNNYPAPIGANTIRREIQDQVNLRKKIREKDKIRRIGGYP